jgi:hypothetical protein
MTLEAAVYGVFSVMSIATGQFFMFQINKELRQINRKLDDILKFLYGSKKSELIAEIKFVQAACNSYSSIMLHDEQRVAFLTSIQDAKKIAIKDIDFFGTVIDDKLNELKALNSFEELEKEISHNVEPIKENYELSLQLYIISCIMDVFFAQNFDKNYINMVENDIKDQYVEQCKNKMIEYYTSLSMLIDQVKIKKANHYRSEKLKNKIADSKDNISNTYKDIYAKLDILHKLSEPQEYCVTKDGTVYRVVV